MEILKKLFKKKEKKRGYEGGSRNKRFSRWWTNGADANAALEPNLKTIRDRARDLRRNDPYANRAVMAIANNLIGKGIKTQFRGANAPSVEPVWNSWAKSKSFDYEHRMNFYSIQHLAAQSVVESGEVLLRRHIDTSKSFPLSYQLLEADFIDTSRADVKLPNGNFILQGIEYNSKGKREAYYLYERHPGSIVADPKSSFQSSRVPASEVHHIYRIERPGQVRGVTWLHPVIVKLKDLNDYEDAQLVKQKVAACFAAFVKDMNSDIEQDDNCDLGERIEPGIIEFLPNGKDVVFANPPSVENYKDFVTQNLKAIATGMGITYEVLTNDLSQVNFSSGRMGHLEFQRNIETWRSNIIYSQLLDAVVNDFLMIADLIGLRTEGLTHVHVAPKKELVDPTREVPATIKAIRSGLTTLSAEILAQGEDPEEHLAQMQKDNELLDKYGLILDSDPRKSTQVGILQGEAVNEEN